MADEPKMFTASLAIRPLLFSTPRASMKPLVEVDELGVPCAIQTTSP